MTLIHKYALGLINHYMSPEYNTIYFYLKIETCPEKFLQLILLALWYTVRLIYWTLVWLMHFEC